MFKFQVYIKVQIYVKKRLLNSLGGKKEVESISSSMFRVVHNSPNYLWKESISPNINFSKMSK